MALHEEIDHTGLPGVGGGGGIDSGTAFPGGPSTGDLFFRTDRGLLYYYDGTRWLTMQMFREPFAAEASALASHTGNDTVGRLPPWHTTHDLWLDTFYAVVRVSTTNNGSNYWTVALDKVDAANSPTTIASFDTTADSANTWITKSVAIGAALTPATYKSFRVALTITSSPGSLIAACALTYRLIG